MFKKLLLLAAVITILVTFAPTVAEATPTRYADACTGRFLEYPNGIFQHYNPNTATRIVGLATICQERTLVGSSQHLVTASMTVFGLKPNTIYGDVDLLLLCNLDTGQVVNTGWPAAWLVTNNFGFGQASGSISVPDAGRWRMQIATQVYPDQSNTITTPPFEFKVS